MKQEDKELLLKDLSARIPYGVKIMFSYNGFRWDWEQTLDDIKKCNDGEYAVNGWNIRGIKPYLRPMSSMTEDEREDFFQNDGVMGHNPANDTWAICAFTPKGFDWLNAHHFDYRGLIEKGLALEAQEGMYKTE